MTDITFRDIILKDYKYVIPILNELTNDVGEINEIEFTKWFLQLNSNHRVIVGEYDNHIVAIGTVMIENKIIHSFGRVAHIEDIAVDKNYQKKNIGKKLIEKLIDIAKEKHVYKCILTSSIFNSPFYEKCGFHISDSNMRINIK
tara:strand:- start:4770 stop:5201 length:432 start_codon:yes stop_codon:yes gene_type:complete